jgi:hypothetical protein
VADLRISELFTLNGADVAAGDFLAVADISASESRKVTVSGLVGKAVTLIADATIPGAKILFGSGEIPSGALANGAVTDTKIASGAVTGSKLGANSTVNIVASLPATGSYTGQIALETSQNKGYIWNGSTWVSFRAAGSVNTVVTSNSGPINLSIATVNDTVTINAALSDSTAAAQFIAGPSTTTGPVTLRAITGADLPVATTSTKGAVIVNGNGLAVVGDTLRIDNTVVAEQSAYHVVRYGGNGLITAGRTITGADLPLATSSATGVVFPGTGLAVTPAGALNHSNSIASGSGTKVSFDAQGHVTGTLALSADDIPEIPATKLTSGTLSASVIGLNTITGNKLANTSVTKFGGAASTEGIITFPQADFTGQYFFDSINGDLYLWDGNAWQPITITAGEIVFAGTYNATTNLIASRTTAGAAIGLTVGSALPAAAASNNRYYVVVSIAGTGTAPAPTVSLAPPDMLLSNGAAWQEIDVSGTVAAQIASNISFVPTGGISANNVQTALEELDTEKLPVAGGTITGELLIGAAGSLVFEGTTADAFETTVAVTDPTADRTITLPDRTGTVITTGDTSTVTNTMLAGSIAYGKLSLSNSILNADINASAAIAYSKLNLSSTIVNADVSTTAAIAYSKLNLTGAVVNADIGSGAAIAYSKLALTGNIVNADINASAAIADTKLATISTAGKVSGAAITSGAIAGTTSINTSGTITTTGAITDGTGSIRQIPQNAKTAAYTLVLSDVGKHISITTGGITVPEDIFAIGDNITIFNNSTSSQTITQGSGTTLRAGGSTNTGNRTLAAYGVATILCVGADVFVITGTGLT